MGTVKLEPLGQRLLLSSQLEAEHSSGEETCSAPDDALPPVTDARSVLSVCRTIHPLNRHLSERSNVFKAAKSNLIKN